MKYAKLHKKEFLRYVISDNSASAKDKKVAIFMAGTPGSGKTEVAETIVELITNVCMIDADRFRERFPGYNGTNSSDFQPGASYLVDYTFTWLLLHRYSLMLDGTFSIKNRF